MVRLLILECLVKIPTHTLAISQVIAAALLNKWGEEGLQQHVKMIQEFYKQRRDTFVALVDKHLTGYVEYSKPSAGMFLWMKLKGIDDSKSLIEQKARDKLVLLVPGQAFQPNDKPTNTVRASFSIESEENMDVYVCTASHTNNFNFQRFVSPSSIAQGLR